MKYKQRFVLAIGLVVIAGLGIFVPWERKNTIATDSSRTSVFVFDQNRGYSFLWNLPKQGAPTGEGFGRVLTTVTVDYRQILLSWTVTAGVTAAVIVLLGLARGSSKKPPDSLEEEQPSAEP